MRTRRSVWNLAALVIVAGLFAFPAVSFSQSSWPRIRGPFSLADNIMNSSVIARSGGIYQLRKNTQALFVPSQQIVVRDAGLSALQPVSSDLDFLYYALGAGMTMDAGALLFADNFYAPSDTLQFMRGLMAYDVRDFQRADELLAAVPESSPYREKAQMYLDARSGPVPQELLNDKKASPLLAAALSTVIPGAGKIYAGDLRSGVSTLLIVGALGAMTAESWVKLGIRDPRTIVLSSLTCLFYIGNIYGSYLSVSVINNAISDAAKATLLFNLRIPLHER